MQVFVRLKQCRTQDVLAFERSLENIRKSASWEIDEYGSMEQKQPWSFKDVVSIYPLYFLST